MLACRLMPMPFKKGSPPKKCDSYRGDNKRKQTGITIHHNRRIVNSLYGVFIMKNDNQDIDTVRRCMELLPASACSYEEWLHMGMVLYDLLGEIGCPEWENWSMNDSRYHEGECFRKWRGFGKNGEKVTVGTIVKYVKDHGLRDASSMQNIPEDAELLDWDDQIPDYGSRDTDALTQSTHKPTVGSVAEKSEPKLTAPMDIPPLSVEDWKRLEEPKDGEWKPYDDFISHIEAVFREGDQITICVNSQDRHPSSNGKTRTFEDLRTEANKYSKNECYNTDLSYLVNSWDKEAGAWIRINPMDGKGGGNTNVTDFRHCLVESDNVSVEDQLAIYRHLNLPCASIVHSGGKSLHAIIRVQDEGETISKEEWKRRVDLVYSICDRAGLKTDRQNKNPSRYTRLPGVTRGGRKQFLVDTNCGMSTWKEWEEWETRQMQEDEEEQAISGNTGELEPSDEDDYGGTVSDKEVFDIINGTLFGRATEIFGSVTNPPLPLSLSLPKTLAFFSLCCTGRDSGYTGDFDDDIPDDKLSKEECEERTGAKAGRIFINTADGMPLNCYVIQVAPSASGKDIGGLLPKAARRLGYVMPSDTSYEGLMDLLTEKDCCSKSGVLLNISELRRYLDDKAPQAKVTTLLNSIWNSGEFSYSLSQHTKTAKSTPPRKAGYAFPTLIASVQPEIVSKKMDKTLYEDGFMGRVLVTYTDKDEAAVIREATQWKDCSPVEELVRIGKILLAQKGCVTMPEGYYRDEMSKYPKEHRSNPILKRYTSEFMPRLAVFLACEDNSDANINITSEHIQKATKLVRWFYGQALTIRNGVNDLSPEGRQIVDCRQAILDYLYKNSGKGTWSTFVHNYAKRFPISKTRQDALKLLVEEGVVKCDNGKLSLIRRSRKNA